MVSEVLKLLKRKHYNVSQNFLKEKLETHPYFPSILAIKDTLTELSIKVDIFQTTEDNLLEFSPPFLAHIKNNNLEKLIFISDKDSILSAKQSMPEFSFTGIIIAIDEAEELFKNDENSESLKNETLNKTFFFLLLLSTILLFLLPLLFNQTKFVYHLLILSNFVGLLFSFFIIEKELGISNNFSDKICRLSSKSGCENILGSKGAKIFHWLSWGDVGICYFATMLTYLCFYGFTVTLFQTPVIYISVISLFFPFYSLYYQIKIIKQFCTLCIGVIAALTFNGLFSIYVLKLESQTKIITIGTFDFLLFILLAISLFSLWFILKGLVINARKNYQYYTLYKRFKRNPSILLSVLDWQLLNVDTILVEDETIAIGNKSAPFNLLIACNPYCDPCAIAHNLVHSLYNNYPTHIRIGIRFLLTKENISKNDAKTKAVRHILQYISEHPMEVQNILHYWYGVMSYDKLVAKFPVTVSKDVDDIMQSFVDWNSKLKIRGTPTFWINGKELPSSFNWTDLFEQLPIIIEDSIEK